jgi:hypothetical protein
MKRHSQGEMISGERGTKVLIASGVYTNLKAHKIVIKLTGSKVTVLTAVKDSNEVAADAVDVLSEHIAGGAATSLQAGTEIKCQRDVFMAVTLAAASQAVAYL